MTATVDYAAYAAATPKGPLERTTVPRREVGEHDVLIEIKYSGICHSDIHQVNDDWGSSKFPMVPGHEIAGIVTEVGSAVTKFTVGDRAGVGCMVDSCRECEACQAGQEPHCLKGNTPTYNGTGKDGLPTYGGYSTHVVVTEDFALRIPEGIGLDVAAPLLCAGITLYSPLARYAAGPGKRVAIVGMGGLGHVGVKIARAMGAEVTVLSQSLSKKEDGLRLGAHEYYATKDKQTFKDLRNYFDLILNTVSADLDANRFLSLLRLDGALVQLGLPETPIAVNAFALARGRRTLTGSLFGGIAETQEMLDFCARNGIGAEVEVIAADQINEAYERTLASDVRYRFVIDTSTI
ncbi:NAD(P)-dependent alcohol dehydrogenase [Pseudonocardiaceae bacterium YIM PH 21723]|nr:NAD(P)-dependent alcohol dehydrogenase [Pseudonocardiaceae bacterium YIM PH 21723]